MRAADRDCHPTDAHGKRIARHETGPVQRFDSNAFVKAKLAQTPSVALGQGRPIDRADRRFSGKGKVCKGHLRAIISIVWRLPAVPNRISHPPALRQVMTRYDLPTRTLAACLAAVAGYVDAIGFMASKGFFVSFMSGNSTRLAVGSVERASDAAAAFALIALFVAGVVVGSLIGRRAGAHQQSRVILLVALLLGGAALLAASGYPMVALGAMALAMGAENAIFESGGEVQIGLTYMTGTLVKLGQRLATALSGGDRWAWIPFAMLWVGLAAGAVCGALAFQIFGLNALWLPVIVLSTFAVVLHRGERVR